MTWTDAWVALAVTPLVILWTTYLHEMGHVYFVRKRGARDCKVYPWWHWYDHVSGRYWYIPFQALRKPSSLSEMYFGRMSYRGEPPPNEPGVVEHIAPLYVGGGSFLVYVVLLLVFGVNGALLALALGPVIDAAVWLHGYFSGNPLTDGYRYRYGLGP